MLEKIIKLRSLIFIILVLTIFLRVVNFSFPLFTSDEARISYRAFTLSKFGEDELGRNFPIVFNSLTDYQLPVTSYATTLGVLLFGKNDFGARMIFILIGVGIIFLCYKIGEIIHPKKEFAIFSALVLSFSPVLIFLSKIPNDAILLIFLILLIFYLQLKNKNQLFIISVILLSLLTSKIAWLVIPPFMVFNVWFYQKNLDKRNKIRLTLLYIGLTLTVVGFFMRIPQFGRSMIENNFSIFSDTSIHPAINRLRGQGVESGWPSFLERMIFNKLHFVSVSVLHWLSSLSLGIYFGQFDKSGLSGFTQMGALAKVLVVPFLLGIGYLLTKAKKEEKLILAYFLIFTLPILFSYPKFDLTLLTLTIPFAAFITSFGLIRIRKIFLFFIAIALLLEVFVNIIYISPEIKNTNNLRPDFVKNITQDIYDLSKQHKVIVSDNIMFEDIVPFLQWHNLKNKPFDYSEVLYPYKFRQSDLDNIKIIGSDTPISPCKYTDRPDDYQKVFLSQRDINRLNASDFKIIRSYSGSQNQNIAFVLERGVCIR